MANNKKKRKKIRKLSLPKGKSYSPKSKGTAKAPKRYSGGGLTSTRQPSKKPAYGGKRKGSGGNLAIKQRRKR